MNYTQNFVFLDDIDWPEGDESLSEEVVDLVSLLLERDPERRLGTRGAIEVIIHSEFVMVSRGTTIYSRLASHMHSSKNASLLPMYGRILEVNLKS